VTFGTSDRGPLCSDGDIEDVHTRAQNPPMKTSCATLMQASPSDGKSHCFLTSAALCVPSLYSSESVLPSATCSTLFEPRKNLQRKEQWVCSLKSSTPRCYIHRPLPFSYTWAQRNAKQQQYSESPRLLMAIEKNKCFSPGSAHSIKKLCTLLLGEKDSTSFP
jgi:hypothetical protein